MKEIYCHKSVNIFYDDELQSMHCEFKGFVQDDIYKEARLSSLEYSERNNITKWLTNHREAKVISTHMQDWMKTEFFPVMLKRAKKIAVIESDDIFNTASLKRINQTTGSLEGRTAITQYFTNVDEAKTWLQEG